MGASDMPAARKGGQSGLNFLARETLNVRGRIGLTLLAARFQHSFMAGKDPRIDAYIAKAAPFAQPILRRVRKLVHQGCPEVQETIKWSMPHFEYHGIMLGMAAFKEHCSIGFWKGELLFGKSAGSDNGMGHFGKITGLKDLPSDKRFIE